MEKISWIDHVRNEEVLLRVNENKAFTSLKNNVAVEDETSRPRAVQVPNKHLHLPSS
jgi:hypothetical protein